MKIGIRKSKYRLSPIQKNVQKYFLILDAFYRLSFGRLYFMGFVFELYVYPYIYLIIQKLEQMVKIISFKDYFRTIASKKSKRMFKSAVFPRYQISRQGIIAEKDKIRAFKYKSILS